MPVALTLDVKPSPKSIPFIFDSLFSLSFIELITPLAHQFVIICDERVQKLYGEKLEEWLTSFGLDTLLLSFPCGEEYKTGETKISIEKALFEKGVDRKSLLIALGGGVVLDLAGFVAATYLRSIPLLLVPTTLLAMVDAAIGGKTAVNTPYGKNLIGAFYHPKVVWYDISLLKTLDEKEMKNGAIEAIKHGLVASETLFALVEQAPFFWNTPEILRKIIKANILIKKTIVEKDPEEVGVRRSLNFGHTLGHAIECVENYTLAHGEAIAQGLLLESRLSYDRAGLSAGEMERIFTLVEKYQFPLGRLSVLNDRIIESMRRDKKSQKGQIRCVMIEKIGAVAPFDGAYCAFVEEGAIIEILSKQLSPKG